MYKIKQNSFYERDTKFVVQLLIKSRVANIKSTGSCATKVSKVYATEPSSDTARTEPDRRKIRRANYAKSISAKSGHLITQLPAGKGHSTERN